MINVLIIDDSALVREYLKESLENDNEIGIVRAVSTPFSAIEILNKEEINVICLDLKMPRMDGLTFLEKLMKQNPLPVVIFSGEIEEQSKDAIRALQLGAVDIIFKAKIGIKDYLKNEGENICNVIKSASKVNIKSINRVIKKAENISLIRKPDLKVPLQATSKIIAIGASTGGTAVLRYIFSKLPKATNGIVITQHMPENFTNQFSSSLNSISKMYIKEVENNDIINIGSALIARGNWHLKVLQSGNLYKCVLSQDIHVNRHRPSVDVMFESVAKAAGDRTLGILLTGMGKDGAKGLKSIKDTGGITIVQEEKSCAVFGMPKAAIDINATDHILSIDEIISSIIDFSKNL